MINVYRELQEQTLQAKLLLQIHDELLFEVHRDDVENLKSLVVSGMESVFDLAVPLKVDTKSGPNWGACE